MDGLNDSCFLLESGKYNEKDCSGGWPCWSNVYVLWTCWPYNNKKGQEKS